MESFNFRNTLRWNRPANLQDKVTYIVQYKMDVTSNTLDYKTICVTDEEQCNTSVITYKSLVRVKMQLNPIESDWVTIHFDPYSQTIIGPPQLEVSSRSGYLDVSFNGPFVGLDEGSLKEKYGELTYRVSYWKESDPAHVLTVNTTQQMEILDNLETWTIYCVKVQTYVSEFDKAGEFSTVICKQTTNDGKTSSWTITGLFLGSMALSTIVFVLLIYIAIKAYKTARYIFVPSYSLPQHLKEFLSKPFYNAPYPPPQPTEECGESYEQLTFVSEETEEKEAT